MIHWLEDLFIQAWLRTLAWSAGTAIVVLTIGALSGAANNRAAAPAVAIALGFAAALVTVNGLPAIPPRERWQWALWLTAASLLLLFLEEMKGGQATLRLIVQIGLVAALGWLVLQPSGKAREWDDRTRDFALYGGVIGFVLFLVLAEVQVRNSPPWRTLVAFAITAAVAAAIFEEQSDKAARITGGLAAAIAVSGVVALVQRDVQLGRTVMTTAALAFGSVLLYLWSAAYVSDRRACLLALAWATALIPLPRGAPWISLALSVVLAAIPAGLAYRSLE